MPNDHQLMVDKNITHSIKALGDTEGGKALVGLLVTDIVGSIHTLISGTADINIVIAEMKARMELSQLIINAADTEDSLDELIKEELAQ